MGAELEGALAGALAAVLLATTPYWFRLHTAVWSEPLYLALLLATALAVIKRPDQSLVHGALALACTVVRHVGVSVAGGAALVALTREGRIGRRIAGAANAALPSLLFFVAWHVFGASADAPVRAAHVQTGWEGWSAWFGSLPGVVSGWLLPIASGVVNPWLGVAAAVGLAAWIARSNVWRSEGAAAFAWFAVTASVLHVVVVTLSSWLVDPAIPLDARMLIVPIALATIAVAVVAGGRFDRTRAPGFLDVTIAVVCVAWVIAGTKQIVQGVRGIRGYGQYYTAALWDHSSVIEWASEEAAQGGPLPYSNEPELVYLRTGRPAFRMPRRGESTSDFDRVFQGRPGPIILVNPIRPTDLDARELPPELGLRVALRAPEGTVLVPAQP